MAIQKVLTAVVHFLRSLGHLVFAYLEELFGTAKPNSGSTIANHRATDDLAELIPVLFRKFGLTVYPTKAYFAGSTSLDILCILVDTSSRQFLRRRHCSWRGPFNCRTGPVWVRT